MGCWSESCALSNLPIDENVPALAFLLTNGSIDSPIVFGLYSEYGTLKDVKPVDGIELDPSTLTWPPDRADPQKQTDVIFIRKDVFDTIRDISCDVMTFYDANSDERLQPETVGEYVDLYRAMAEREIEKFLRISKSESVPDSPDRIRAGDQSDRVGLVVEFSDLVDCLKQRDNCLLGTNLMVWFHHYSHAGAPRDKFNRIIDDAVNSSMILQAFYELRKPLAKAKNAPQHGGLRNAIRFNTIVTDLARQDLNRYG